MKVAEELSDPSQLDNREAVFICPVRPECNQLIYLYQGRAHALFMSPLRFLKLSQARRRNLVMLRDLDKNHYHGPLSEDWPNIEASIEQQRKIQAKFTHTTETYCTGTSAGGYAAILFGHYLKADIVYAFGAPTRVGMEKVDPGVEIPEAHRDLSILLAEWNGQTRYQLYYCEDYKPDRTSAERLADCPGVELIPLPGNSHNVFKNVDTNEFLSNLFPPIKEKKWWKRLKSKLR